MSMFISLFSIIMTSLTTIIVAAIGLRQAKVEKQNEEYRRLEGEHADMLRDLEEKRQQSYDKRFNKLESDVKEMRDDLNAIKEEFDLLKLSNQLTQLHTLNQLNFEYVQSLSGVVSIIGEILVSSTIMDDSTKDRMHKEIDKHKHETEKISSDLIKIII